MPVGWFDLPHLLFVPSQHCTDVWCEVHRCDTDMHCTESHQVPLQCVWQHLWLLSYCLLYQIQVQRHVPFRWCPTHAGGWWSTNKVIVLLHLPQWEHRGTVMWWRKGNWPKLHLHLDRNIHVLPEILLFYHPNVPQSILAIISYSICLLSLGILPVAFDSWRTGNNIHHITSGGIDSARNEQGGLQTKFCIE